MGSGLSLCARVGTNNGVRSFFVRTGRHGGNWIDRIDKVAGRPSKRLQRTVAVVAPTADPICYGCVEGLKRALFHRPLPAS